jgi:Peptidase family C25
MASSYSSAPIGRCVTRDLLVNILRTALSKGHTRFARETALAWLANFPGDLPVSLLYAQILLKDNQPDQALSILDRLCQTDPEFLEAFAAKLDSEVRIHRAEPKGKNPLHREAVALAPALTKAHIYALGGNIRPITAADGKGYNEARIDFVAAWSQQVRDCRKALEQDKAPGQSVEISLEQAEELLHGALADGAPDPLVAITHLKLLGAKKVGPQSICKLAEYYHQRWPDCLQFNLLMGNALMEAGEADKAVDILHKAAARDVTGQVVSRLWGDHHPYLSLWPDRLAIDLDVAIPAPIAAALGWNQLPEVSREASINLGRAYSGEKYSMPKSSAGESGTQSRHASPFIAVIPESLRSVQEELERVAVHLNKPALARSDGRFPVYVVMTTRRGLETQYDAETATRIVQEAKRLVSCVQKRRDWHSLLFLADDTTFSGMNPARYNDPWALKLALTDLDAFLAGKGEMIGAVLIIGGPEVVPFHCLPNPVDDADDDVPSDNPYGTRDENYFIPEWPVGRIPGGASKDATELLNALSTLTARHAELIPRNHFLAWLHEWRERLVAWFGGKPVKNTKPRRKRPSFGYTAAVWRKASLIVFRPIGESKALKVSPPLRISSPTPAPLPNAHLGYFNLHGVVDAVEWFGQSDPTELSQAPAISGENGTPIDAPDYPVAVRPQDIQNSGRAPEVVFSEACYGTHILGKTVEEALALKFIQAGSQAVVGSTCTAYGSIGTPLIAADFLGHAFWDHLRQGCSAGEALRRAKITLAREMHQRQGYLDGEDQKTLISFVLYGDPLSQPLGPGRETKSVLRPLKPPTRVKTVCDRARQQDAAQPIPVEIVAHAKLIVQQYLPGMEDAQMTLCQEHTDCSKAGHLCPTAQLGTKTNQDKPGELSPKRRVVVLSKQVTGKRHLHRHFARLTLDEQNNLVKLVVSR